MANMDDTKELLDSYKRKLQEETDGVKVLRILKKFKSLPITVELLQATGVGKTVSALRKWDGEVGREARDLVAEWKRVVTGTTSGTHQEDNKTRQSERKGTAAVAGALDVSSCKSESVKSRKSFHLAQENGRSLDCHSRYPLPPVETCEKSLPQTSSPKKLKTSPSKEVTTASTSHSRLLEMNTTTKELSQGRVASASRRSSSKKKGKGLVDAGGDGFNASMASFEACLGLNDAKHTLKKKRSKAVASVVSPLPSGSQRDSQRLGNDCPSSQTNSKSISSSLSPPVASGSHGSSPVLFSKHQTSDVDILSSLPVIQTNYKPLRFLPPDSPPPPKKKASDMDSTTFMSSRNTRTQVFSGRRSLFLTEVPTLMKCCIKVLQENVNVLGDLQFAPFEHIKHVLLRCSPERLLYLEEMNPYLLEDSDELWMFHCQRDFRNNERDEFETWRELYYRLSVDRTAKLRSVTANICASMAKAIPVRQTKLAYLDCEAKPPRSVARQQAKFGTASKIAAKETVVKLGRPGGSGFNDAKVVPPHSSSTGSPSASSDTSLSHCNGPAPPPPSQPPKVIKKVAPLMQKTLKFMKNRFRR